METKKTRGLRVFRESSKREKYEKERMKVERVVKNNASKEFSFREDTNESRERVFEQRFS